MKNNYNVMLKYIWYNHTLVDMNFMIPDSIPIPDSSDSTHWLNIFDSRSQEWNQENHIFWFTDWRMESKDSLLLIKESRIESKDLKKVIFLTPFLSPWIKKSDSFDSILDSVSQKYWVPESCLESEWSQES